MSDRDQKAGDTKPKPDESGSDAATQEARTAADAKTAAEAKQARKVYRQKWALVRGLTLVSFVVLLFGGWVVYKVESPLGAEVAVGWAAPERLALDPGGPVSFHFDWSGNRLIHRGPIDEETKDRLLALFPEDPTVPGVSPANLALARRSYQAAIERLAFESGRALKGPLVWLLLLGGIGGVVGVQLRSISNFLGVACVRNRFDFERWWPWYVLRPVLGFLVGILVVVLVKADLFTPGTESAATGSLWWLGLAVLAGFGAEDFGLRLRLISHTLFGVQELAKNGKKDKADEGEGDEGRETESGTTEGGNASMKGVR